MVSVFHQIVTHSVPKMGVNERASCQCTILCCFLVEGGRFALRSLWLPRVSSRFGQSHLLHSMWSTDVRFGAGLTDCAIYIVAIADWLAKIYINHIMIWHLFYWWCRLCTLFACCTRAADRCVLHTVTVRQTLLIKVAVLEHFTAVYVSRQTSNWKVGKLGSASLAACK